MVEKNTFWCKCSVAGGGCGSQARVEGGSTVTEGDVGGGGGQSSVE